MEDPIITFIIPTIGRQTLQKTIHSLLAMNDIHWKAILLFDGITQTISNTDDRITIIEIDKLGRDNHAGDVRNIGIHLAVTPWVGFVDDDDTLDPNYITHLKSHITNNSPEVVIFRMRYTNGQVLPPPCDTDFSVCQVGISFCFNKDVCTDRFLPSSCEDFILLDTLRSKGHKIIMSPHVMYYVRH